MTHTKPPNVYNNNPTGFVKVNEKLNTSDSFYFLLELSEKATLSKAPP